MKFERRINQHDTSTGDSCVGLRFFICPTLVSCWLIHLSQGNYSFATDSGLRYKPGGGTPYTGRLRPKGVPFSDFRYIKG